MFAEYRLNQDQNLQQKNKSAVKNGSEDVMQYLPDTLCISLV